MDRSRPPTSRRSGPCCSVQDTMKQRQQHIDTSSADRHNNETFGPGASTWEPDDEEPDEELILLDNWADAGNEGEMLLKRSLEITALTKSDENDGSNSIERGGRNRHNHAPDEFDEIVVGNLDGNAISSGGVIGDLPGGKPTSRDGTQKSTRAGDSGSRMMMMQQTMMMLLSGSQEHHHEDDRWDVSIFTDRERQWIERIQLLQISCADSLKDDFYNVIHHLKTHGQPCQTVRVVPSDSRPYEPPLSGEPRTLGRLSALSSSHPRQLIHLDGLVFCPRAPRNKQISALVRIESIYDWLLKVQSEQHRRLFQQTFYGLMNPMKVIDPSKPLAQFLSTALSEIILIPKGKRLIGHLLPVVNDFPTYAARIMLAVSRTGHGLDRETYHALQIQLCQLPIDKLCVLADRLVRTDRSKLAPLVRTRFGLTILLRLAVLCATLLWPTLAALAAKKQVEAVPFPLPVVDPLNGHPHLIVLRNLVSLICELLQPVETRNLQIPFEPVPQLAVTFQRVLVAAAAVAQSRQFDHHQSTSSSTDSHSAAVSNGSIASGVLAKLEYLEARSVDKFEMHFQRLAISNNPMRVHRHQADVRWHHHAHLVPELGRPFISAWPHYSPRG